jgi:hypothetical protein
VSAPDERVRELEAQVAKLQRALTFQRDNNHKRNVQLDALHFVWCDGGCIGGTHRFTEGTITEEIVAAAERNTKRLRSWFQNRKLRDERGYDLPTPCKRKPRTQPDGGDDDGGT